MINKVKFDYFGDNTDVFFNTKRIRELNQLTKISTGKLLNSELDVELLVAMLQVGLAHKYGKVPAEFYDTKLDAYLETSDNGYYEIWKTMVKALIISGVAGKKLADFVLKNDTLEIDEKDAESLAKNV